MLVTLQQTGVIGMLIVLVGIGLGVAAIVYGLGGKREGITRIACASAVPFVLGLIGTWLGYRAIAQVVAVAGAAASPADVMHGKQIAWKATYLGAGAAVLVLIACGVAWAIAGRSQPGDAHE
jgi:hypothetical protein